MRILLTGNKGFLGSEIEEVLTKENADHVYGLDCDFDYAQFQKDFRAFAKWRSERNRLGKVDLVIHCGAVADSREQSNLLWQLNYQASREITQYCSETNTKLIFISSAAAIDPDTPYGWSKQCAEFYMHHRVAGMNLCILRPYNIWAFDEDMKNNPSIVSKMLTRTLKEIYWRCTRDFIYISDVVNAVQQVVHDWTPGTFDIGTAEPTDIHNLACYLYGDEPKPPVRSQCPIREKLVARHEHLLPNWEPGSIEDHLESLKDRMMFKQVADIHSSTEIDYSAEDH